MQKNNWKKYKFSELGKIVTGKTPSTKQGLVFGSFLPFLTPSDITGQRKIMDTLRALSQEGAASVKQCLLPPNSVCVTCIGSDMGKTIINTCEVVTNQQINSIIIDTNIADSLYVYYAFCGRKQEFLTLGMAGSTMPILNKTAFANLEISLPPLDEQKRIAEILGAFDDKIELLQKQNKTLEDMAKAIFKSWFVDFDVVKAKQRGDSKANIMREYHLTEELYALFPSSFEDSSLGPIPTGWEVKSAGELLEFSIGGGWGNEELTEDFCVEAPVIRGTDIPALRSFGAYKSVPVRYHKGSNHTSRKLKSGDIVLEVAGGSKGQPVGRALFISDYIVKYLPEVICASFCKLLRLNKNLLLPELFYIYLDFMYQTGEIEQYQVQSTGISNFQFKQFCENKHFVVPPQELQTKLSLGIFIDKMSNNKKQIQTLTELRDSLLPRLISGKIRV